MKVQYKVTTFNDSEPMVEWLNDYRKNGVWAVEGIWGTPAGIHVLYAYEVPDDGEAQEKLKSPNQGAS